MSNIFRLYSNGINSHAVEEVARLLGIGRTSLVEVKKNPSGEGVIITKAKTNAEKRKIWKRKEIDKIPIYIHFARDGNTLIGYYQYEGRQKSAFAICDPNDEFDLDLGKCIVYWRLCNWTLPDFIFED